MNITLTSHKHKLHSKRGEVTGTSLSAGDFTLPVPTHKSNLSGGFDTLVDIWSGCGGDSMIEGDDPLFFGPHTED